MSTKQTNPETNKPISTDIPIDYPLTNPAQKAHNDRLDHEAKGQWSKPAPIDSNIIREGLDGVTHVPTQQPEEFEASGGQSIMDDNSDIKPEPVKEDKKSK